MEYKPKTFKDGTANIYEVKSTAIPGKTPKKTIVLREKLRYNNKTVGITRFYSAKQNGSKADNLIECPKRLSTTATDVAILEGGKQYQIVQVQYPEDAVPPTMLLTLERLGTLYDISGT